jgi:hypothetical protein
MRMAQSFSPRVRLVAAGDGFFLGIVGHGTSMQAILFDRRPSKYLAHLRFIRNQHHTSLVYGATSLNSLSGALICSFTKKQCTRILVVSIM